ncbi:hypothetical protein KKB64_02520 [Patescibacteria group bacterium]|nr:hypothetical protein [Patescibacteria group bacterium]MBU2460152.1 hypothetical protein [Patescibacteria group bacterium]MBU2544423.1 hypothetical protein [Patescibacteria group bacterium]
MNDESITTDEASHIKVAEQQTQEQLPAEKTGHTLRSAIEQLAKSYAEGISAGRQNITPVHVDEMASRLAKFYEMVRKVIDWKEDNVLRRSATERILKRLLFPKLSGVTFNGNIDTYKFAYIITIDLIRGGHLPNDEVPQESIQTVELALKKYLYVLAHAKFSSSDVFPIKRKINFATFLIELAACEIEEILTNPVKEQTLLRTMTDQLNERISVVPSGSLSEDDKKTQVFIATCRTLYDLDDQFILYQLLKFAYPSWSTHSQEMLEKLAGDIPSIWERSNHILEHPLARQFYTICERLDTIYTLLGDVMDKYKSTSKKLLLDLTNRELITKYLTEAYEIRYVSLKSRLVRLAIFSTLSVFLSNWATFFIVEVPLAELFYEGFNLFTAFMDFLIPTAVMFILVIIIRPPAKENLSRVLQTAYQLLYDEEKNNLFEVRVKSRRNPIFTFIIGILYTTMSMFFLVFIAWIFYIARLPFTSVVFDTFTIALTIFAAVLIRNKARELNVDDRVSIWEFFLDMFSVPIAKIGSFLAAKWKEYNIIAILFTFLIETPLVVIVDFIESWSQYIKERRSELH